MDWLIKSLNRVGDRFLITPPKMICPCGLGLSPGPPLPCHSLKGSGLKNRNFRGFFPSEKVPKNIFGGQSCLIISDWKELLWIMFKELTLLFNIMNNWWNLRVVGS
jgi:hypothetical protein